MKRRCLIPLLILLLLPTGALAEQFSAVQGEIVTIHKMGLPAGASLHAFGKQWPVKVKADGSAVAWVGVDLKTIPGNYPLQWRAAGDRQWRPQDRLAVAKGHFRISRITVEKKMAEFDAPTLARIRRDQRALKATYGAVVEGNPDIVIRKLPAEGVISTPFGAQRYVNGEPRSPHSGIDIAASEGTPVYTPLAGRVLLVSEMYLNGNTVVIGHGYGMISVFCHLQESRVRQGDWVDGNILIGRVGSSGRATGPHLHWGIRFNRARVDPLSIYTQKP